MIRINLLKPLETKAPPLLLEAAPRGKKPMLILAGLALVAAVIAVVVLKFPSLLGGLLAPKEVAEAVPVSPAPAPEEKHAIPKMVDGQAVEETVRDIQPDQVKEQLTETYTGMVPSRKIEFQYYSADRILKDIKAVTPPDIGFANFIFTPPGDFYVHGLAADEQDLQRFQQGLSGLAGAEVKPGMNVPAGTNGKSKEFSFFVTVKYPLNGIDTPPDHVIAKAGLQQELKQLKTVAAGLGIRLKEPHLSNTSQSGKNSKLLYQTSADCDFQQLQDLLAALHQGKSNLGFIRFSLRASGDEKVTAEMDLLAYVRP